MSEQTNAENNIPDPDGPPTPADPSEILPMIGRFMGWTALTLVGSGTAFILFAAAPTRTLGALRSHRLKWEQRKEQIDQAVAGSECEPDVDAAAPEKPHD